MSTWEPSDQSPFTATPYDRQGNKARTPINKPARWRTWRVVNWLYRGYAFCLVRMWHLRRGLRASTLDRFDAWRHARWIDGDFAGMRAITKSSVCGTLVAAMAISSGLVLGSRLDGRSWMLWYYRVPLVLAAVIILMVFGVHFLLKESVAEYGRRYTLYRISDPADREDSE